MLLDPHINEWHGIFVVTGDEDKVKERIKYRLKEDLTVASTTVTPIDSREMTVLSRLICNNEEIGFSNVLLVNGRVTVVDGPLFSLEGIILSVDHRKERAKVRLNFLGEERTVDLGISFLRPA